MSQQEAMDPDLARLTKLHKLGVLDSSENEAIDQLVHEAVELCGVHIGLVTLIDESRQWFKSTVGLDGIWETPREIAFCNTCIETDAVLVVEDAHLDPRFSDNPLVTGDTNICFYAGAPLVLETGIRLGSLCLLDAAPNRINDAQRATLQEIASKIVDILRQKIRPVLPDTTAEVNGSSTPVIYAESSSLRIVWANQAASVDLNHSALLLSTYPLSSLITHSALMDSLDNLDKFAVILEVEEKANWPDSWRKLTIEKATPGRYGFLKISVERDPANLSPTFDEPDPSNNVKAKAMLTCANRLLINDGIAEISMRKVADAANVGLGHLQYYFPNKKALQMAMLDCALENLREHHLLNIAPLANPRDRYMGIAQAILEPGMEQDMFLVVQEFWSLARQNPEIADKLRQRQVSSRLFVGRILMEAAPNLTIADADLRAAQALALLRGAAMHVEPWVQSSSPPDFRDHIYVQLLQLSM